MQSEHMIEGGKVYHTENKLTVNGPSGIKDCRLQKPHFGRKLENRVILYIHYHMIPEPCDCMCSAEFDSHNCLRVISAVS